MRQPLLIIPFTLLVLLSLTNVELPADNIVKAFKQIDAAAHVIRYTNELALNHEGGHIQGVQWMEKEGKEYIVMTGSSSTYSYYTVLRRGGKQEVISVNRILDKPYKHAGGFQINDSYMAIGIEDNEARNTSKVYVYNMADPEQPPQQPLAIIERNGAYERATAGSVGIMKLADKILLVVGDWSSRHLDFYIGDEQLLKGQQANFEKVYTISEKEADKEDWTDQEWPAYQNINLIKDAGNNIFLLGLARNDKEQEVADLFKVETKDFEVFKLQKVASQQFKPKKGTSFKWGAGVVYDEKEGSMRIISSTPHMKGTSILNEYK